MSSGGISSASLPSGMPTSAPTGNVSSPAASGVMPSGSGPAAWNEEWRKKFLEAGIPSDVIMQMTFTGGMGKDAAGLQAMIDENNAQSQVVYEQFKKLKPEEFEKLQKYEKDLPKIGMSLAQIANLYIAGQLPDAQLKQIADQASMIGNPFAATTKQFGDMFLKNMLPWTIPGWGAIRWGLGALNGGKDPISGEKIHYDFWNHGVWGWMDFGMAVAGTVTLGNAIKGGLMAHQGLQMAKTGGFNQVLKAEGLLQGAEGAALTGWQKFKAYVPHTRENVAITGMARMNNDFLKGLSSLQGEERMLAQSVFDKWKAGEILVHSNGGVKITPMGTWSTAKGTILHRNRQMISWSHKNGMPVLEIDPRLHGKPVPAFMASAGVDLLPVGKVNQMKAMVADAAAAGGAQIGDPMAMLRKSVLGEATRQLRLAPEGFAASGLGRFWSSIRPGALEEAIQAAGHPASALQKAMDSKAFSSLTSVGMAAGFPALFIYGMKNPPPMMEGEGSAPGEGDPIKVPDEIKKQAEEMSKLPDEQKQAALEQLANQVSAMQQQATTPEQQKQIEAELMRVEYIASVVNPEGGIPMLVPTPSYVHGDVTKLIEAQAALQAASGGQQAVAGAGQVAGGGAAQAQGQVPAELEQMRQAFAQLPADKQQEVVNTAMTDIQTQATQPNLTDEQKQQVLQQVAELEYVTGISLTGGGGTAGTAQAAGGAAPMTASATPSAATPSAATPSAATPSAATPSAVGAPTSADAAVAAQMQRLSA